MQKQNPGPSFEICILRNQAYNWKLHTYSYIARITENK